MQSLEGLVCPKCREPLTVTEAGRELYCVRDGSRYPLIDGIPSFMLTAGRVAAVAGGYARLEAALEPRPEHQLSAWALSAGPRSIQWVPAVPPDGLARTEADRQRLRCSRGNPDPRPGGRVPRRRSAVPLPGARRRSQSCPALQVRPVLSAN